MLALSFSVKINGGWQSVPVIDASYSCALDTFQDLSITVPGECFPGVPSHIRIDDILAVEVEHYSRTETLITLQGSVWDVDALSKTVYDPASFAGDFDTVAGACSALSSASGVAITGASAALILRSGWRAGTASQMAEELATAIERRQLFFTTSLSGDVIQIGSPFTAVNTLPVMVWDETDGIPSYDSCVLTKTAHIAQEKTLTLSPTHPTTEGKYDPQNPPGLIFEPTYHQTITPTPTSQSPIVGTETPNFMPENGTTFNYADYAEVAPAFFVEDLGTPGMQDGNLILVRRGNTGWFRVTAEAEARYLSYVRVIATSGKVVSPLGACMPPVGFRNSRACNISGFRYINSNATASVSGLPTVAAITQDAIPAMEIPIAIGDYYAAISGLRVEAGVTIEARGNWHSPQDDDLIPTAAEVAAALVVDPQAVPGQYPYRIFSSSIATYPSSISPYDAPYWYLYMNNSGGYDGGEQSYPVFQLTDFKTVTIDGQACAAPVPQYTGPYIAGDGRTLFQIGQKNEITQSATDGVQISPYFDANTAYTGWSGTQYNGPYADQNEELNRFVGTEENAQFDFEWQDVPDWSVPFTYDSLEMTNATYFATIIAIGMYGTQILDLSSSNVSTSLAPAQGGTPMQVKALSPTSETKDAQTAGGAKARPFSLSSGLWPNLPADSDAVQMLEFANIKSPSRVVKATSPLAFFDAWADLFRVSFDGEAQGFTINVGAATVTHTFAKRAVILNE